jgi:hypothetical protein
MLRGFLGAAATAVAWWAFAATPQDSAPVAPPIVREGVRETVRAMWTRTDDHGFRIVGQCSFHYGRPSWNPGLPAAWKASGAKRWRFGKDFWTTFESDVPCVIGGVALPPGQYYVAAEIAADGGASSLVFLDAAAVRSRRLDAAEAGKTTDGLVVPLVAGRVEEGADPLTLSLTPDATDASRLVFRAAFGPHRWSASLVASP